MTIATNIHAVADARRRIRKLSAEIGKVAEGPISYLRRERMLELAHEYQLAVKDFVVRCELLDSETRQS